MDRERLEWHLENWQQSHRGSREDLGVKIAKAYGDSGVSGFDDMAESVDGWAASVVETVINDIGKRHKPRKDALHYHYLNARSLWCPTHYYDLEMAYSDLLRILPEKNLV